MKAKPIEFYQDKFSRIIQQCLESTKNRKYQARNFSTTLLVARQCLDDIRITWKQKIEKKKGIRKTNAKQLVSNIEIGKEASDTRINNAKAAHSVIFAAGSAQIHIVYKQQNIVNETNIQKP